MTLQPAKGVSVVIPVFNAAKYLRACVESVLLQTAPPLEILLMDDASTDGSANVARRLAVRDSRIRVLQKPRTTLGDTRNQLVRSSRGERVAFLDADDMALPDRLEKQNAFMAAQPDCVAVGGHVRFVDEWGHDFYWQPRQALDPAGIEAELLQGRGAAICQPTLMLRRDAFDAVGGYDATLNCSEDLDLFLRLAEYGKLWNLPDVLVRMRRHPSSITSLDVRREGDARRVRIVEAACRRRGITVPALPEFRAEAVSRSEWYLRTARGYLAQRSFRIALMHGVRGLTYAPFSLPLWRLVGAILVQGGKSARAPARVSS